jgi:hypothetical protein
MTRKVLAALAFVGAVGSAHARVGMSAEERSHA